MKKLPTNKWGLLNSFTIYPEFSDEADWTDMCLRCKPFGTPFSAANRAVLSSYVEPWMRLIVEIGVSRDGYDLSSSKILIENKHPDCRYVGIDPEDRSWITSLGQNVTFLRNSSWDVIGNLKHILNDRCSQIDLLMIDGDHSVNSLLKEWEYAKFVPPGGAIVLHDTNFHPGPWCLCESVDPNIFEVTKLCEDYNDYGLAVLRRR
jgi:hypothetical protein